MLYAAGAVGVLTRGICESPNDPSENASAAGTGGREAIVPRRGAGKNLLTGFRPEMWWSALTPLQVRLSWRASGGALPNPDKKVP